MSQARIPSSWGVVADSEKGPTWDECIACTKKEDRNTSLIITSWVTDVDHARTHEMKPVGELRTSVGPIFYVLCHKWCSVPLALSEFRSTSLLGKRSVRRLVIPVLGLGINVLTRRHRGFLRIRDLAPLSLFGGLTFSNHFWDEMLRSSSHLSRIDFYVVRWL